MKIDYNNLTVLEGLEANYTDFWTFSVQNIMGMPSKCYIYQPKWLRIIGFGANVRYLNLSNHSFRKQDISILSAVQLKSQVLGPWKSRVPGEHMNPLFLGKGAKISNEFGLFALSI